MKRLSLVLMLLSGLSLMAQQPGVERDGGGRVVRSSHGVYDASDRLAVLISYTYDSAGVVETRTIQSYDQDGRPKRREVYTADEYLIYTEGNRYDRHGNRTRCIQTTYDEDGNPTCSDYRYAYARISDGNWQLTGIRLNGKVVYSGN